MTWFNFWNNKKKINFESNNSCNNFYIGKYSISVFQIPANNYNISADFFAWKKNQLSNIIIFGDVSGHGERSAAIAYSIIGNFLNKSEYTDILDCYYDLDCFVRRIDNNVFSTIVIIDFLNNSNIINIINGGEIIKLTKAKNGVKNISGTAGLIGRSKTKQKAKITTLKLKDKDVIHITTDGWRSNNNEDDDRSFLTLTFNNDKEVQSDLNQGFILPK